MPISAFRNVLVAGAINFGVKKSGYPNGPPEIHLIASSFGADGEPSAAPTNMLKPGTNSGQVRNGTQKRKRERQHDPQGLVAVDRTE